MPAIACLSTRVARPSSIWRNLPNIKPCSAFIQCVCVAVMHQDYGECILLLICCWGLSVDRWPHHASICRLPAGVIVCQIRYLPPYSFGIIILIQNWWAPSTKGFHAYAQTTSSVLTKGCRDYVHKTRTPLTKGLHALNVEHPKQTDDHGESPMHGHRM